MRVFLVLSRWENLLWRALKLWDNSMGFYVVFLIFIFADTSNQCWTVNLMSTEIRSKLFTYCSHFTNTPFVGCPSPFIGPPFSPNGSTWLIYDSLSLLLRDSYDFIFKLMCCESPNILYYPLECDEWKSQRRYNEAERCDKWRCRPHLQTAHCANVCYL